MDFESAGSYMLFSATDMVHPKSTLIVSHGWSTDFVIYVQTSESTLL